MWCSTALIPLCVAIIYYKIIRNNSSVSYEMYKEEQLFMMMKALHFLLQIMVVRRVIGHIKLSIKK